MATKEASARTTSTRTRRVLAAKIRCLPMVDPGPPAGPRSPGAAPTPGLTGRDIAALERLLERSRGLSP